jgi:flagellar hook-basal body complex protein FliE
MNFMPFQPIMPISNAPGSNFIGLGNQERSSSVPETPFENYLSQALNGVNDSIIQTGDLYQKAVAGKVQNLHQVTIAAAEAEVLLKLATGITSKLTTDATTLFQMQF